jgi:nitric oxide reductase subunit C
VSDIDRPAGPREPARDPRVTVFAVMVLVYVLMAVVTYLDYPRRDPDPPLTDLERSGLAVWREYNCQACHQIYGFGGFLGPDLTNRVTDDTRDAELAWILTSGVNRMPAFDMTDEQKTAIFAFLRAVNRTGQSQPTPLQAVTPVDPVGHFRLVADTWEARTGGALSADARAGVELMSRLGCGACHQPFAVSPLRAPDLSGRAVDRSTAALEVLLDEGRGRMPAFGLGRDQVEQVGAFLDWLADHRAELVALDRELLGLEPFSWRTVPWFEYR